MWNFIKYVFATAVGVFVGSFLVFGFLFSMVVGLITMGATKAKKVEEVKEKSVLVLKLSGEIKEKGDDFQFDFAGKLDAFKDFGSTGLYEIKKAIKKASEDEKVESIYLRFRRINAGWATVRSIRESLEEFKKSKKKVYAYSDNFNEKSYYLASVADKVVMHPIGDFELNGLGSNPVFLKKMFKKIGVEPRIFKMGKFKAAVEPLILEKMSKENREQVELLLNDFWDEFAMTVSKDRGISLDEISKIIETLSITNVEKAKNYKLVDELMLESDFIEKTILGLKEKIKEDDYKRFIGISKILNNKKDLLEKIKRDLNPEENKDVPQEPSIAIIFAEGDIVDGKGKQNQIGSDTLVQDIQEARLDESIKGIILRVNSPGGSALASDVIWSEIEKTKKIKPVYASFGDMAASGGYYISAGAEKIYAHPNTVTGSIGVFGVLLGTQELFEDKMGLTFDRAVVGKYADLGNANRDMKPAEKDYIQTQVKEVYQRFLSIVQKGRKFDSEQAVDLIAQGRVWSGTQAKKVGLVDELGSLNDAVSAMAKSLKLPEYEIKTFSNIKGFGEILKSFKSTLMPKILSDVLEPLQVTESFIKKEKSIVAIMPYRFDVN